jgi:putative MATE family efflux protein
VEPRHHQEDDPLVDDCSDRYWVGDIGTEALAALGVAHVALMVLFTIIMGMGIGTLAGVSRCVGAGRIVEASSYFTEGMVIAVVLGFTFMVAAAFVPQQVMTFMGVTDAVSGPSTTYLAISMVGSILHAPLLVLTFALQGAGEARAAVSVQVVAPIVNGILDPLFIFTLDLGLPGAAWATLCGNGVALVMGGFVVSRRSRLTLVRPTSFARHSVSRQILKVGFPGALEHTVRTVAAFSLVRILADFGAVVLSAYTTVMVLIMMLIFPGLALGQATSALVGQNLGAARPRRAWTTAWAAVAAYAVFMLMTGALVWAIAPNLVRIFDSNPAVVREGTHLLRILVYSFPVIAVALILSKAFAGAGATQFGLFAAAAGHLLFQLPAAWFLVQRFGPEGAYWAMTGAFGVHALVSGVFFVRRFRPPRASES